MRAAIVTVAAARRAVLSSVAMKRAPTAVLLVAWLTVACAKSPRDQAPRPSEAKPAAASPVSHASTSETPSGPLADPENGDFTVEEATAGLEGQGTLMAQITTDLGAITCELFPDKAPRTVASFVGLARGIRPWKDPKIGQWIKGPYFDGLAFHRVIPEFMIQGGDPLSRDYNSPYIGSGGPGYGLPDEIAPELKFDRPGRLAMANTGPKTQSGGSQFFITEVPRPQLDGGYVIFGQCGQADVVKQIARVEVDHPRGNKPRTPVIMAVKVYRR